MFDLRYAEWGMWRVCWHIVLLKDGRFSVLMLNLRWACASMISTKLVWKAIFLVEYEAHISGVRMVEASVRRDFSFCWRWNIDDDQKYINWWVNNKTWKKKKKLFTVFSWGAEDEFRCLTAWAKKQTIFAYSDILEEKMRLLKVVNSLIEIRANNTVVIQCKEIPKTSKKSKGDL